MAENLLADLMGSLLIVAPAAFGIVFAYWLYKKLCKISLFRQSREDDEALLRRMEMADAGEAEADSYQKLRQIYRDIQAGAKAFLAAVRCRLLKYWLDSCLCGPASLTN